MTGLFNFVFEVEDQRDWQRRPGCHVNPFSCFFCHLLKTVAPWADEVHDVTYGVGSFYQHCPNLRVYAADIRRWQWIVTPATFREVDALTYLRELPTENRQRRVVVIDPPYPTHPAGNSRSYEWLYYPKPWQRTYLVAVLKEARSKARAVLLKYMPSDHREEAELTVATDYVVVWRFVKAHIPVNGNIVVRNASKIFIFLG
ncbi:MAG: hypothetical protein ACPL3C_08615 [Pyrobaculum sp.]